MAVDIAQVIQEIREEAEIRKGQPPHPDRKRLKPRKFRIRPVEPPFLQRAYVTLKREKWRIVRRIYDLPFVGYSLKLLANIARLPTRFAQIYSTLHENQYRLNRLEDRIRTLHAADEETDSRLNLATNRIQEHWEETQRILKRADALEDRNRDIEEIRQALRAHSALITDSKAQIQNLQSRPVQGFKSIHDETRTEDPKLGGHSLDRFYYDFEEKFRGSREKVREKLQNYIPYFKNSKLDFSKESVLDIGCGRGEWIKLLQENGIASQGIDLNEIMVQECKSQSLDVTLADAFDFLKVQSSESLGAVTGFHIVEHIPFRTLIKLIDEVYRVIKPGGMAIFETPNPENLTVASLNFYIDPTHINPLPPPTLAFFMEQRGFHKYEVLRLSAIARSEQSNDPLVEKIADCFYKEQDYAIIAFKY